MPESPEVLRPQLQSAYEQLAAVQLDQHARDFWRMRAAKQREQVRQDALLHEHTAIMQYLVWHAADGSRLPVFMRSSDKSLAPLPPTANIVNFGSQLLAEI